MPPKSDTPSNFSLKLRKHIRTRRVESVSACFSGRQGD